MIKRLFTALFFITSTLALSAQQYDSTLAAKYGADDYGMRQYVMAFLKRGTNTSLDSAARSELQKQHLKNIIRMADAGKLVLAGPFMDAGEVRGIYVFDVRTIEEARKLTETDPAIKENVLTMELRPWYGSAALMAVTSLHKQIQMKSVAD